MKKLIATILILLMTAGLCGCDSGSTQKRAATDSDLTQAEIEKIVDQRLAEEAAASAGN